MTATIPIGFEVGTGTPVSVPVQHLAVTGQTQLSGKTTTLEALVARSGLEAIAFVTKRGEASFTGGHTIAPYFRERADWQFVSAVLEATLREKMRFERSWIMRACKGAKTLADVQRNVRRAMERATGLSADVYMTLDHYLDIVIPQIERLPYSDRIELRPGLNVMELSDYTTELQALVIRSVMEWVYEKAEGVLVIIPEAWEFIPQQRGSPVLLACEVLIRKSGNLRNFVWLDSQDIAGVHKNILRQVGVWIIGVQREANEVKRALAHVPGFVRKPKVDDVMGLERGQFYVCFGKTVTKVYVQPAWMTESMARSVACGASVPVRPKEDCPAELRTWVGSLRSEEAEVHETEARALREENKQLKAKVAALEAAVREAGPFSTPRAEPAGVNDVREAMRLGEGGAPSLDMDSIYAELRRRILADPIVLAIVSQRRELVVNVERKTLEIDGASLRGRVARLLAEHFFAEGMTNSQTRTELRRTGPDVNNANLARVLADLQRDGFLTCESGERFKEVEGMKVRVIEQERAA
jgi:hypothetical protein